MRVARSLCQQVGQAAPIAPRRVHSARRSVGDRLRSYREAVLDMFVFQTLNEVREQTEKWLKEYNEERPHDALRDMTPREYLLTQTSEVSTYDWS